MTAVLIGIPFDAKSSFLRGPALAPQAIREALASPAGNSFTEDLLDLSTPGVWRDAGDLNLPGDALPVQEIARGMARLVAPDERPIVLGGDHSITYPVLRAVRQLHQRLTILHFDAHSDLYDHFEGDRLSHACPFARIMEEGLADRLVQVGVRTLTRHQAEQAERFGVDVIDMRAWSRGVRPRLEGPVWVSLDLDVLDPAFAPGVSHREPGGLTTRELLTAIEVVDGQLVGADLVELNPTRDVDGISAGVAAKLLKELAAKTSGSTSRVGQ